MLKRRYEYRRNLPHIQKGNCPHFITFDTYGRWTLPPAARDITLHHCLYENGKRCELHVCVIMPEHVHVILTFLRDKSTEAFTFAEVLHSIKSASAHSINRLLNRRGHVWQDESFDHALR